MDPGLRRVTRIEFNGYFQGPTHPPRRGDQEADRRCRTLSEADLMDGDVDVRVEYSTVNYKDGLAITGGRRWCGVSR